MKLMEVKLNRIASESVKTALSGEKYKPDTSPIPEENTREVCLNCDKPKCKGYCEKVKGGY